MRILMRVSKIVREIIIELFRFIFFVLIQMLIIMPIHIVFLLFSGFISKTKKERFFSYFSKFLNKTGLFSKSDLDLLLDLLWILNEKENPQQDKFSFERRLLGFSKKVIVKLIEFIVSALGTFFKGFAVTLAFWLIMDSIVSFFSFLEVSGFFETSFDGQTKPKRKPSFIDGMDLINVESWRFYIYFLLFRTVVATPYGTLILFEFLKRNSASSSSSNYVSSDDNNYGYDTCSQSASLNEFRNYEVKDSYDEKEVKRHGYNC